MKITVLGAGAMGMLFGGCLSRQNEVTLVDVDEQRVRHINQHGILLHQPGGETVCLRPKAATSTAGLPRADLVILFVKSLYSAAALEANRAHIGPETFLLTLQNGSGHEDILLEFAPANRIILGATQHNSSVCGEGEIHHGGGGQTHIGLLQGDSEAALAEIGSSFNACGFATSICPDIQRFIWNKMFLNVSGSVMTAVLQTPMGYLVENSSAWQLVEQLAREAVAVANAKGLGFEPDAVVAEIRTVLENSREGYTSIYADIRDGRQTEVDTISGSVVRAAKALGVPVPTHEIMVGLIHAMEGRA